MREIDDDDEGRRLVRIVRRGTGSVVTWRRAQMVPLSAQGMDAAGIARVAFTSEDRVRDVIRNFNTDGFSSLYPKYRGGRPPKFTLPQRREIKKIAKSKDGQIRPAAPVGAWNLGPGRQIVSQDSTKRRQPNRRSDRDPVPLTLVPRPVTLGEAAPEALPTLSLLSMSGRQRMREALGKVRRSCSSGALDRARDRHRSPAGDPWNSIAPGYPGSAERCWNPSSRPGSCDLFRCPGRPAVCINRWLPPAW